MATTSTTFGMRVASLWFVAIVGKNAALAVGGVVALCGLAFSPVSGASLDSLHAFTYVMVPLAGVPLAAAAAELAYGRASADDRDAARGKGTSWNPSS